MVQGIIWSFGPLLKEKRLTIVQNVPFSKTHPKMVNAQKKCCSIWQIFWIFTFNFWISLSPLCGVELSINSDFDKYVEYFLFYFKISFPKCRCRCPELSINGDCPTFSIFSLSHFSLWSFFIQKTGPKYQISDKTD